MIRPISIDLNVGKKALHRESAFRFWETNYLTVESYKRRNILDFSFCTMETVREAEIE